MSRAATTAPGRRRSSSACTARGCGRPQQMDMSRWNAVAERQGFIVVYPSGTAGDGPRVWHVDRGAGLMSGCQIHRGADRHTGGGLQHRPGEDLCQRACPMAAAWRSCCPARCPIGSRRSGWWRRRTHCRGAGARTVEPVPMIAFHGTADPVTPYNGGRSWVAPRPFPEHPDLDGELGSKKPVRTEPSRLRGGGGCHPARIHELCGRRGRRALHDPGRRPHLAGRRAAAGSGSSGPPAAASTRRVRCGRSFVSTGSRREALDLLGLPRRREKILIAGCGFRRSRSKRPQCTGNITTPRTRRSPSTACSGPRCQSGHVSSYCPP